MSSGWIVSADEVSAGRYSAPTSACTGGVVVSMLVPPEPFSSRRLYHARTLNFARTRLRRLPSRGSICARPGCDVVPTSASMKCVISAP